MHLSRIRRAALYCCAAVFAISLAQVVSAADENAGKALFEEKCHLCHEQPDPAKPPDDGWVTRLDKMSVYASLKGQQKEDVLAYLLSHSQDETIKAVVADDQQLLKEKCMACHTMGRIALEKFDGDIGQHILDRMQTYAGTNIITDEELHRILAYLQGDTALAKPERTEASNPADLLTARCTACHSLERVFAKIRAEGNTDATWTHIVSRMREKAPDWLSEEEATALANYIASLDDNAGAKAESTPETR